jgi:cytochrome P450
MAESVDARLLHEIASRRAQPERSPQDAPDPRKVSRDRASGPDICSLLVQARFEDGTAMSDREVRDQLMTLLLAGHETTATGLAWTLDLLTRNPDVLRRAQTGGDEYLRAVVAESLRLRPVVPLAGRRLVTDLVADGVHLPAGTDVTPAIWLTHTRPEAYPDPYAFRPERFLDKPPSTYSWIPYGGGVRRCLGAAFAEMEMRVVLAEILRRFDLRAASRRAERVARRNVTFSPRHGTRVIASPRAA